LSLQGKLSAFLDGPQSDLDAFSKDLYGRLPKNHGNASANGAGQQKVKENGVREVRKKYRLLEMEDEILEPPNAAPAVKESKKHRSDRDSTDVRKDEKEREGRSHKSKKLRRKEDTDFVGAGTDERSDETEGLWGCLTEITYAQKP